MAGYEPVRSTMHVIATIIHDEGVDSRLYTDIESEMIADLQRRLPLMVQERVLKKRLELVQAELHG